MYLVLYCHNIGKTDFSFFETEDFDVDNGYVVRGKWPNEKAFRDHVSNEFGDLTRYKLLDLLADGQNAEHYTTEQLISLAEENR